MQTHIYIKDRKIGPGCPVYIIAEMSANHGKKLDTALQILREAKRAGADAVKVQTYTPDTLTLNCDNDNFRIGSGTPWSGQTLHELYRAACMPWEWYGTLQAAADELGIDLFSTPFDHSAVSFLEPFNPPAYKIASFEIVDLPLIQRVAQTGKPLIMSTGMASLAEIDEAVQTARKAGAAQLALMHCTSAYPAPPQELNLHTIRHLSESFAVCAGLSDHSPGIAAPCVATALGACIIEKHFTLSRNHGGPDSSFSLEPEEFQQMVASVRIAECAPGTVSYRLSDHEQSSRIFRRSLYVVRNVKAGEAFTEATIRSIRPGNGLHTRYYDHVLTCCAARDIPAGTPLQWSLLGGTHACSDH